MAAKTKRAARGVFGLALLAALGFGATQALAAPASAEAKGAGRCTDQYCKKACAPFYGYCDYRSGLCACAG